MAMMAAVLASQLARPAPCSGILPNRRESRQRSPRPITSLDVLRLRDFGPYGALGIDDRMFALSPDRRMVAIEVRRADSAANRYCIAVMTVELATGRARVIDDRGELIRVRAAYGNAFADVGSGVPAAPVPAFSPDGRSLLYIRQDDGRANVWRADLRTGRRIRLTDDPIGVMRATWSADGRRIVFSTSRGLGTARARIAAEGAQGWHYDGRIFPARRAEPYPEAMPDATLSLDLATRHLATAPDADVRRLESSLSASRDRVGTPGIAGTTLERVSTPPDAYQSRQHLRVRGAVGTHECQEDPCAGARAAWLDDNGRSVLLAARTGWGEGSQGFFRWSIATGKVEALSTTSGVLLGCQPFGVEMLCARETATTPRQLVAVNPTSGRVRVIFDPNPGFVGLQAGHAVRLDVSAANGTRTFADVLLPPGYDPQRRYPLVIVQYDSRGFLRGGTGEEYPIPALAAAGMIVMSFQRPKDFFLTSGDTVRGFVDATRINAAGWADRKNVHSALIDALDQASRLFAVDPHRVGITGLSDGTATAAYALIHSNRFAVAALSACCEEPVNDSVLAGQFLGDQLKQAGYPTYGAAGGSFWQSYSIAANVSRIKAPILIQAPDSEFILSLPTLEALRTGGAPVDLYVFPGEFHVKWQPRHKLAVYKRTIRWFGYWFGLDLRAADVGREDPVEHDRWDAMRQARTMAATPITPSAVPRPPHP